jgi:hypothetical protein
MNDNNNNENKYARGKIYKIVDYTNDNIYIGSTIEPILAQRLAKHIRSYKSYLNGKQHFLTSFKILENDNYDIQLIENYPCDSKDELHQREGYYIKTIDCVNKNIPNRNYKQYYEDNKDKIKQYRKDNKDKIKKFQKQYREDNKDKTKQYQKKYYENNKDKMKQYYKKYYEDNKTK